MVRQIDLDLPHRKAIDEVMKKRNVAYFLEHLPPGLKAVGAITESRSERDCTTFAFDLETPVLQIESYLSEHYIPVGDGLEVPGNIVIYRLTNHPNEKGMVMHAGIYVGKDIIENIVTELVLSRWGGNGPRILHPIDHVPSLWGDSVEFWENEKGVIKC